LEIFDWLESTTLARTVGESLWLTASLSATHLIGFTLVMSGGIVWNLRASGLLLGRWPSAAIARPAIRILGIGLTISLITGFALFSPRASYTAPAGVFQLKMALLLGASIYQFTVHRAVRRIPALNATLLRAIGVIGLLFWISLAVVACWFILFE